jgi:signal transduction histidine kinase
VAGYGVVHGGLNAYSRGMFSVSDEPPSSTAPPSAGRFPVVVVEDDTAIRELTMRAFRLREYVVHGVVSAEDALVKLASIEGEVILVVDKGLPGMNGMELIATLGAAGRDFEAVVITAAADVESLTRALHLGVFRCLHKPFVVDDLAVAVAGAANRLFLRLDLRARKHELEARNAQLEASVLALRVAHEQRILSDRLASIGRLAAGIAHEINTPLASVIANLALVSEELPQLGSPSAAHRRIEEALGDAREAAGRVRTIVADLRSFSRGDDSSSGPVAIRPIIEATINMSFSEIRHRARLVKDFGETLSAQGNEARLGQLVLNLLVNAAHAIPEGNPDRNEIRVTTRDEKGKLLLEVKDSGAGLSPSAVAQIFDPYIAESDSAADARLGLSICKSIVTAFGGEIVVSSKLGLGTTVRVLLPVAAAAVAEEPRVESTTSDRRARVLVVDDDELLLATLNRVLSRDHKVVTAVGARDALAKLEKEGPFDAILCDLMMPGMNGMDLYADLEARAPELAASMIFLTGGAFTRTAQEFLDRVTNLRMNKPFDPKQLRAVIADRVRKRD